MLSRLFLIFFIFDGFVKSRHSGEACAGLDPVTGVQSLRQFLNILDSGFRLPRQCASTAGRNDRKMGFRLFTKLSSLI